jgi:hypothetical protein
VIADLAMRGLATLDEPVELTIDPQSGFPVITFGRRVTTGQVADLLDDE